MTIMEHIEKLGHIELNESVILSPRPLFAGDLSGWEKLLPPNLKMLPLTPPEACPYCGDIELRADYLPASPVGTAGIQEA